MCILGYHAIDDITLRKGQCDSKPSELPPSDKPPVETKLSCDFEDGSLCGWIQKYDDDGKWILSSGVGLNNSFGPVNDHTTHLTNGKSYSRGLVS